MKQLVLLGGGHAHVHVLKDFAANPPADTRVTLITPYLRQVYSGMLPGWIAGHYTLDDCIIPLAPLADAATARLVENTCRQIDFSSSEVVCESGERIQFDYLSIDTGSVANAFAGADRMIAIRPIEKFITAITHLKQQVALRHQQGQCTRIAVIGGGAGGVEIALALQFSLRECGVKTTIISAANTLPGRVGPRIRRALDQAGVLLHSGAAATAVDDTGVRLANTNGQHLPADFVIGALGAATAAWPRATGLACDGDGSILTNDKLQSISHPQVFAAGDCAAMQAYLRPKSGVYAVRAGPPLANNLRHALTSGGLESYTPQARSLYLISTGGKHAIGAWGGLAWEGDWVWRWKDRIDRAFMAKYRR